MPRVTETLPGPPWVSGGFGESFPAAQLSQNRPWLATVSRGRSGSGPRAAMSPGLPSALPLTPVPYQCLTSALPSALPRIPYEFTRQAHPIFQITSPALPEEKNFCVSEAPGV